MIEYGHKGVTKEEENSKSLFWHLATLVLVVKGQLRKNAVAQVLLVLHDVG
jgi:hypothetical protein